MDSTYIFFCSFFRLHYNCYWSQNLVPQILQIHIRKNLGNAFAFFAYFVLRCTDHEKNVVLLKM